jgi:hypothetical protein
VETGTNHDIMEELWDVSFHFLFHADMAPSRGEGFTIDHVPQPVEKKLPPLHLYVFEHLIVQGGDYINANRYQIVVL